jgi:hypothetical protein
MRRGAVRSWMVLAILVAVGGAALTLAVRARLPQGDDVAQIRAMLDSGERAVEQRNVSGMMRHVSEEYRDPNGLRREQIRFAAARALRNAQSVDVTISEPSLRIQVAPDGKRATLACDASLALTDLSGAMSPARHFHLTLDLKKEPARVFGVFPTHAWRVVSAGGYGALEGLGE